MRVATRRAASLCRQAILLICLAVLALSTAVGAADKNRNEGSDRKSQPLFEVLQELCRGAGLQLVYSSSLGLGIHGKKPPPGYTFEEAMTQALRGTGLTFEYVNLHTVTIVRVKTGHESQSEKRAQSRPTPVRPPTPAPEKTEASLDDLIVTGTHLRGVEPVGVELLRITRPEIERSGKATVQDLMTRLPQYYLGGAAEGTPLGAAQHLDSSRNISAASGASLRGLTSGATLVLLNGRRMAPGAGGGRFVDISTIPLVAIQRIEILPDGASAIYGADAIGGVINLILRNDYEGSEALARFGAAQGSEAREREVAQLFGGRWASGHSMLSLSYRDRSDLKATERPLSSSSDLRPWGGDNYNIFWGNPGTILAGADTFAIPRGQNGRELTRDDLQAGTINRYNQNTPLDILPKQRYLSAVGTLRQDWSDRTEIFFDALVSERRADSVYPSARLIITVPNSNPFYVDLSENGQGEPLQVAYDFTRDLGEAKWESRTTVADTAMGATTQLSTDWSATAYLTYSTSREWAHVPSQVNIDALNRALADSDARTAFNPFADGSFTARDTLNAIRADDFSQVDSRMWSANVTAQGELARWGGAPVLLVFGAAQRSQFFELDLRLHDVPASDSRGRRDVTALHGELQLPFAGGASQLSLAARLEHDDVFGSATAPRVGWTWSPLESLRLRASWSKSFKSPSLEDLDESFDSAYLTSMPDPSSPSGLSPVIVWGGGSPDLAQESAKTWTLGFDARVPDQGLSFELTYFNTALHNRVDRFLAPGGNNFARVEDVFNDPRFSELLIRNPSPEFREDVCRRSPLTASLTRCLEAPIAAIVDFRTQNVLQTHLSGIDFRVARESTTRVGQLEAALSTSYFIDFSEQRLRTWPRRQLLDTPGNPLRFGATTILGWTRGAWSAQANLNYSGAYHDPDTEQGIDAWETVDFRFSREIPQGTISLSVQNAFNQMPGFWNNPLGFGYDMTNGNVVGRYASVELRKRW